MSGINRMSDDLRLCTSWRVGFERDPLGEQMNGVARGESVT